jgi:aspartate-semialdehyde dehydrogenase
MRLKTSLAKVNDWVNVIPNDGDVTMVVTVVPLSKVDMGPEYWSALAVRDQLLRGTAEPLRSMLRILLEG